MTAELKKQLKEVFLEHPAPDLKGAADAFQSIWLQYEPKSTGLVAKEQRDKIKIVGAPVKVLRKIGAEAGKIARDNIPAYLPLATLLWDEYGREGRIVSVVMLGKLELADPEQIFPVIMDLCRTCQTWEDCDQLAMRALEPIVRKEPDRWLPAMQDWMRDDNKWVQRAGVTVVGRLPMKHKSYTKQCLEMLPPLLTAEDRDLRRAVSFAIRLCARGDLALVLDFLSRNVPPADPAATWVLCDAVRSMTKRHLPKLKGLLSNYQRWAAEGQPSPGDLRSIQSAVKTLQNS